MDKATKQGIIAKFGANEQDTGSSVVQVALLTQRINELTDHLRRNKKDNSTRHGLLNMVSARRKLLAYINKEDNARYLTLTEELNIRRK